MVRLIYDVTSRALHELSHLPSNLWARQLGHRVLYCFGSFVLLGLIPASLIGRHLLRHEKFAFCRVVVPKLFLKQTLEPPTFLLSGCEIILQIKKRHSGEKGENSEKINTFMFSRRFMTPIEYEKRSLQFPSVCLSVCLMSVSNFIRPVISELLDRCCQIVYVY